MAARTGQSKQPSRKVGLPHQRPQPTQLIMQVAGVSESSWTPEPLHSTAKARSVAAEQIAKRQAARPARILIIVATYSAPRSLASAHPVASWPAWPAKQALNQAAKQAINQATNQSTRQQPSHPAANSPSSSQLLISAAIRTSGISQPNSSVSGIISWLPSVDISLAN